MAGKPLSAKSSSTLSHIGINRMPDEDRQQRARRGFFCRAHSREDFQTGDLTGVQRGDSALLLKNRCGPFVASRIVNEHRPVDQSRHALLDRRDLSRNRMFSGQILPTCANLRRSLEHRRQA